MVNNKTGRLIIAVDGPAGSGKSTVSKLIAERLGILYIDTGAMYRALTLKALEAKCDLSDEEALTRIASGAKISFTGKPKARVILDGTDVTEAIRTPELTNKVKYIAKVPGVREKMVAEQRAIGSTQDSILDGRDIGTVVFPDASYKFYLDASVRERALRRHKELLGKGQAVSLADVEKDVVVRDESDFKRAVGPLKAADDALRIDTTSLSIEEVAGKILSIIDRPVP